MAILLYTTAIVTGLVYLLYRRLMPRPLPGIPYDAESAARISGNKPAIRAAYRQHGDFNTYRQELTHKLGWPLVQLFTIPGTRPILYLSDPREMEDIVLRRNKEFDRSSITSVIIGTIMPHSSIVKPSGPHHKSQRKPWTDVMAPDFLRRIVAPSLYEAGLELIELWKTKSALADGAEIDILHDFDTAALDAIWVAVLGEKLGGLRDQIASPAAWTCKTRSTL
ncbi:hypothetical protein G7054_g4635 [Neopestalotiopsis clavispora]|nr:hypothetical protein G7054_g4635 [Neopestalotiopsis clavispora]